MSEGSLANMWDEVVKARSTGAERTLDWSPAWHYANEHHISPRGDRLTFDSRPYMVEPYRWLTPANVSDHETDFMKSPQVGVSIMLVCAILGLTGELGWRVLYILDTYVTRNRFVQLQIKPAFRRVAHYRRMQSMVKGAAANLSTMEFGRGTIVFAGSNTPGQFIEYQADLVVNDELDKCDLDNVAVAIDRIGAKESKKALINVSSPTHEGFGISEKFNHSTKNRFCRPCPGCDEVVPLEWEGSVAVRHGTEFELLDRDWHPDMARDIRAYCPRCGSVLDRALPGRWVAENPDARATGWHIPKIIDADFPFRRAWEEWETARSNATKRELWWNRNLGLPHSESGSRLDEKTLARCAREYLMPSECAGPSVMGIDVGKGQLHVHVTDEREFPSRTVFLGTIPVDLGEVLRLCRRLGVRHIVFDADPETNMIAGWCVELRRKKIKAWRCRYAEDQLDVNVGDKVDHEEYWVKPDRTVSLDTSTEDFTADEPRVILPADFRTIDNGQFLEQMGKPVRVIEERRGRAVAVWKKNPPEDYRHAVNYCRVARDLFQRFGGGGRGSIAGGGRSVYGPRAPANNGSAAASKANTPPNVTKRRGGIMGGGGGYRPGF